MKYVGELVDETDALTRKYIHIINNDVIETLQRSMDKISTGWIHLVGYKIR